MRRAVACAVLGLLLPAMAFAQAAAGPAFEIADIHASPRTTNLAMRGNTVRDGRYELRNATMVDLIRTAYGVDADKVVGGPSWLELDRFDVIGKVPAGTNADTARLMLRTLLADRFTLVLRGDTKPITAFVMTVASGKPTMKEADAGSPPGCQPVPQTPDANVLPMQVAQCRNMTMAGLAQLLPQAAGAYVTSPVTDSTGLAGGWDFELRWHARGLLPKAGPDGVSIFDALERQLGLKLELKTAPASVHFVESVTRTPTPNASDVAKVLPPPPPAEFEVAELKPTEPGYDGPPQGQILPNGRVNARGIPLRDLIALAWDVTPEMLANVPPWAESARYDLVARATTDIAPGAPPIDIETLRQMLQKLLVERFKMKTHMEERPVSAYTLFADNPKLTKADPASRTRCVEGPGPNARDPRNNNPILSRLVTCQNMTMTQFAERLQGLAPGYIRVPVLDATKLEGAYDLTFNFSPIGAVQGGAGPVGEIGQGGGVASDPTGAMSLFQALPRQLGLKLELQKRPNPVLVIDAAERLVAD
jgi:uncharacterized protein (TIGR03435 family)